MRRRSLGTSSSESARATRCSSETEPAPPTLDGASADDDVGLVLVDVVGEAAVPDTATAVEPPLPLCVTVTTADLVPALVGWKATCSRQLPPTGMLPTTQVFPDPMRKSDASAPLSATAVIWSGALPLLVSVVPRPDDMTPTDVIGNATEELAGEQIGVAVSTLMPDSVTVFGELAALLVIVKEPVRVPAAVGAKVTLIAQLAPGATVAPVQVPVAVNSGFGDVATVVIVRDAVPEFVTVTAWAALVVPTVCVANDSVVRFRFTAGIGTALPVPDSEIAGLVAALEATVNVAVRVPEAPGTNVADSVHVPLGATVAPMQEPVAVKSAAFVPLLFTAVIVRLPAPVLVSVTAAGTGVALLVPTCVAPNASEVAEAEIAGAVAAAGFAMYAAISAASVFVTYPRNGPISGTPPLIAARMTEGLVPLLMFLTAGTGVGP